MPQAVEPGGDELQAAEQLVDPQRRGAPEQVGDHDHQQRAEQEAEQRRDEDEEHGLQMPPTISEPAPALASTAPTMPPISACEELDGMPYHQVTRFQAIAPISAPKTT